LRDDRPTGHDARLRPGLDLVDSRTAIHDDYLRSVAGCSVLGRPPRGPGLGRHGPDHLLWTAVGLANLHREPHHARRTTLPGTARDDSGGSSTVTELLIQAQDLRTLLTQRTCLVFDVRHSLTDHTAGRRAYSEGHIPGALFLDTET